MDADIYFAHVYITTHRTLAAIFPMAAAPGSGCPTAGGIYIAESVDGLNFGPPVLLQRSMVYLRRTSEVPVRWPSLQMIRGQPIDLPIHLRCRSRMPSDAPGRERFKWWKIPWPKQFRVPTMVENARARLEPRSEH